MRDFYEVLGVAKDADPATIRKAYKKLARQFHPDLNQGNEQATERFKEISAAYDVLGDEERRQLYDEFGEASTRPGFDKESARAWSRAGRGRSSFNDEVFSAEDIFANIFGGGFGGAGGGPGPGRSSGRGSSGFGGFNQRSGPSGFDGGFGGVRTEVREPRKRREKGADIETRVDVDVLDAVQGADRVVTIRRPANCRTCDGQGGRGKHPCKRCGGAGRVTLSQFGTSAVLPCDLCGGGGYSFDDECATCAGTGREVQEERLKVKIPPGVEDCKQLRLRGKGAGGKHGGPPGDLLLEIRVVSRKYLRREGRDLVLDVPVTFSEALTGARIEVPTLDGRVRLKVPKGAGDGQRLRLKGKGPLLPGGEGTRGDLFVVLRPVAPTVDDADAIELARGFDRFYGGDPREGLDL